MSVAETAQSKQLWYPVQDITEISKSSLRSPATIGVAIILNLLCRKAIRIYLDFPFSQELFPSVIIFLIYNISPCKKENKS